jgi:hypothetical protein
VLNRANLPYGRSWVNGKLQIVVVGWLKLGQLRAPGSS